MSKTQRNVPFKKLTPKEKKLALRNKLKHGLDGKNSLYEEPNFSQSGKKEAKKEKHRKQRIQSSKEIEDQTSDPE
jgi:hypothetical protein